MPMILTMQTITGCTFYEATVDGYYSDEFGLTWMGTYWQISSSNTPYLELDPFFRAGLRPEKIRITYVDEFYGHDWRFVFVDTGFNTIGDSGVIPNPGGGDVQYEITIPLTFGSNDLYRIELSWSTYDDYGRIHKIEYCTSSPLPAG
jgi:hypothetical protein